MLAWEGVCEFAAVAEHGSFTRAAQALGLSVSQVSRQLTRLEARLGTQLLYRSTRHVTLTDTGQLYLQHCRQLLDSLGEAERAVSQHLSTPQGSLKVTAPLAYGESHIAPLLLQFGQRYPALDIKLQLSNEVLDLVHDGYDLAIRIGQLPDSSLIARRLAGRHLHICAAPAYLAAHGTPQTLAALEQHNCLLGSHEHWFVGEHGKRRPLRVHGRLRCNSGHALTQAALAGHGIVQLPDYYVAAHLASGALQALLTAWQPPEEGIWALYPHNRQLSPKVRMLVDFLADRLGLAAATGV